MARSLSVSTGVIFNDGLLESVSLGTPLWAGGGGRFYLRWQRGKGNMFHEEESESGLAFFQDGFDIYVSTPFGL